MEKEDKIKEIAKKYSKCIYYDYELYILSETETSFILSNKGDVVSANNDINSQFMLIKDTLGFEETDRGTFQKEVNKFDSNIKLKALKLVSYQNWLLRVVQEKDDKYLVISNSKIPETKNWYIYGDVNMKWVKKSDVSEILPFITYWKK